MNVFYALACFCVKERVSLSSVYLRAQHGYIKTILQVTDNQDEGKSCLLCIAHFRLDGSICPVSTL